MNIVQDLKRRRAEAAGKRAEQATARANAAIRSRYAPSARELFAQRSAARRTAEAATR